VPAADHLLDLVEARAADEGVDRDEEGVVGGPDRRADAQGVLDPGLEDRDAVGDRGAPVVGEGGEPKRGLTLGPPVALAARELEPDLAEGVAGLVVAEGAADDHAVGAVGRAGDPRVALLNRDVHALEGADRGQLGVV
jgi:hypothetical protein